MSYCEIADYPKERIELACDFIDRITGQFFEPREVKIKLDGRGGCNLVLPYPLINADEIRIDDRKIDDYIIYYNISYPKIYRESRWTRGFQNIFISGTWGYKETPLAIKRIAEKLALYHYPKLSNEAALDELNTLGRIQSETTDGHSYTLANIDANEIITGDREIDEVLNFYRKRKKYFRMAII